MGAGVAAVFTPSLLATLAILVALGSTFTGALMERYCFFAACPAPRMPGGVVA
jgi:hypothetical protein